VSVGRCDVQASQAEGGNYEAATPVTRSFAVLYRFAGFFQPVDNGAVLNKAKAGSAIPVKFSLNGNQGLDVFLTGYPISQSMTCPSGSTVDMLEETAGSGSGLSYDPVSDQYVYVWKTTSAYAGSCRRLLVKLRDGSVAHEALFQFVK